MTCVVKCVCFCVFAIFGFLQNLSLYCMQTSICLSTPGLILTLQGQTQSLRCLWQVAGDYTL